MCRRRYSSHKYVLTSVVFYVKYLNSALQFSEVPFAKPRFLASFHKSEDVEAPAFLPGWDTGTYLDGACQAVTLGLLSHTPWCLSPCLLHLLIQLPDPCEYLALQPWSSVSWSVWTTTHEYRHHQSWQLFLLRHVQWVFWKVSFFFFLYPLNDFNFLEAVDLI